MLQRFSGPSHYKYVLLLLLLLLLLCNSCFNSLQTEDICFVLQLTVCSDIQTSLNSVFISECLQGENAPFCHLCASKQDAESQFSICEVGCYVIVQLKRFFMIDGVATKNAAPVVCSPYLSVPVRVDDEVTGSRKFALVSGICHIYKWNLHGGKTTMLYLRWVTFAGYWSVLVSAGQSNFCIYQFSRKLQTTLSFGVFEFETKTWKHLFSMKFGRLTNLVVLKLNSKPIF